MKVKSRDNTIILIAENSLECYRLGVVSCDIGSKMTYKTAGGKDPEELTLEVNVSELVGYFEKLRMLANRA